MERKSLKKMLKYKKVKKKNIFNVFWNKIKMMKKNNEEELFNWNEELIN